MNPINDGLAMPMTRILRATGLHHAAQGAARRMALFLSDRRGLAAVEFALILPIMLLLYLGGVEVTQAVTIDRKLTLTVRTVADLASQSATLTSSDVTNILNASVAVMAPYSNSKVKLTVSAIDIDSNGKATVAWSRTLNGTARSKGATVTVPSNLKVANTTLVWSEGSYAYKPTIGYVLTGTLNLEDQLYMRPRVSDKVNCC